MVVSNIKPCATYPTFQLERKLMSPLEKPTMTLREAAKIYGIGQSTAYEAARKDALPFPVLKVNSRYIVPTKPLLETLGLNDKEVA